MPGAPMRPVPLFTALLGIALCAGCCSLVSVPPLDPLPRKRVVLREVRYTPQQDDWDCGPACLTTVMRYRGSGLTLKQVMGQLKRSRSGGTLFIEMIYGARKNGLRAKSYRNGGLNDLRRKVLARKPLILMLRATPDIDKRDPKRRSHYAVAVGYDDDKREVILHSGAKSFTAMSYRQLQLQWGRTRFLTLLVEE